MAVIHEHLEPGYPLGWRYSHFRLPVLPPRWHVHPEFELTLIVRGHGARMVGDSVEEYQPGDLVLIGPGLAHTYASVPDAGENEAVVLHFTRDFLGAGFFDLPAFAVVATMLDAASAGLRFDRVPPTLHALSGRAPAELTLGLLEVLVELARGGYASLATGGAPVHAGTSTAGRTEAMVAFVHARYHDPIGARDVAAAAYMNASAASRLFARSTGHTIARYINIVRINAACRLLRDTDAPVAAIAGDSGFANLSNFNRRFRELRDTTPREYRALFRAGHPEPASPHPPWTTRAELGTAFPDGPPPG
jgi:AraC-like DNA-binding protein